VQVDSAQFLLSNSSAPEASDFSGSVLQPGVRGTGHLVFTATDAGGPGIYRVTAQVDGTTVSSATPSTDGGRCVAVGDDPGAGALMFDWQQPCPQTEVVDAAIPTANLPDGGHELTITLTDAAQNSSTVFDQTISTSNPHLTPVPGNRHAVHARFNLSWRWDGGHTRLLKLDVLGLPRLARVALRCEGRGCPRLRVRSAGERRIAVLLSELRDRTFRAGDRLLITVTAPRHAAERIEIKIRDGRKPSAGVS
jgi:hypothetical protein